MQEIIYYLVKCLQNTYKKLKAGSPSNASLLVRSWELISGLQKSENLLSAILPALTEPRKERPPDKTEDGTPRKLAESLPSHDDRWYLLS